ncbi:hypothetical protein ACFW2V_24970 [Streptomyces sp. NPDC058947]|uniref:hypothetical protein n=1 Tax=Streptomyces sp. NPDC058947 TaxID=3346675 RepID=UPI0036C10E12
MKIQDRLGEALGRYRHGQVLLRQGRGREAIAAHERTLAMLQKGEQDYVRCGAHVRLAQAHLHLGQADAALHHAEEAWSVSQEVRHEQLAGLSHSCRRRAVGTEPPAGFRTTWRQAVSQLARIGFDVEAERVAQRLGGTYEPK